jgi:phospholipase D
MRPTWHFRPLLPAMLGLAVMMSTADAADRREPRPPTTHGPIAADVSVCFVPAQECDIQIVEAITRSVTFIRVQAYGFTSQSVLSALAEARARGVDVQAILDKSDDRPDPENARRHAGGARFTADSDIPTWIDSSVAIAHNKVIVIDGHMVIGGSYNYTASAEHRNAENVTFIDAPVVADFYLANWEARKAVSHPSRFMPENRPSAIASSATR